MPRFARIAAVALGLLAAGVGSATVALAFDKVDTLQPVQAGRGYVYYIREVDAQKQPLAGRTVTVKVGTVPGSDASVAPSDSGGHASGAAGASATEQSGSDGLAYFLLRTSTTPGQNQFTWTDTTWTGEVLITGTAPAAATAKPASAAAGGHGSTGGGVATHSAATSSAQAGGRGLPPIAAGLIATAAVWVAVPPVLARRRRRRQRDAELAAVPSLSDRLPFPS